MLTRLLAKRQQRQRAVIAGIAAVAVVLGAILYITETLDTTLQTAVYDRAITNSPAEVRNQITIIAIENNPFFAQVRTGYDAVKPKIEAAGGTVDWINAGRSPCGGVLGGVDSVFEDCFVRASWAVVHPASKATEATAATAKVIALFTKNSVSIGMSAAE